jgi:hypothetical protein
MATFALRIGFVSGLVAATLPIRHLSAGKAS